MSWRELRIGSPDLAEFGAKRFASEVAFLATVKKDGSPRVHPVTPIIGDDHLFIFMVPTSPKGFDLRRNGLYALHSSVNNSSGEGGEFLIFGTARLIKDDDIRDVAVQHARYKPEKGWILFELEVDEVISTLYDDDGTPVRKRWEQNEN
jgi:nitroimidazol reductase NimA-like FMN-containing flavoprotein (pyridoxamine 5'-phosphate oxidase superfamily)